LIIQSRRWAVCVHVHACGLAWWRSAELSSDFDGMQPMCGQLPPNQRRSMIATLAPRCRA
jgi:hypothetical protein